jgi:UDP-N-acetylglucosamine 2-epimerase (non-hydrolysing)
MIMAVGDVNSTLCAAIVANKNNIPLAHLESGLRSNDKTMPEEINRILVDELTDHFFVTEDSGIKNLLNEGKNKDNIHFVGNTMIDTMVAFEKEIQSDNILEKLNVAKKEFILMTLHRPSNVDNNKNLLKFVDLLKKISISNTVVIPFHPRTINKLKEYNLWNTIVEIENIIRLKPIGYFSFQKLISHSKMVITDSGGIQEETTFKNIPCITIRENTERPITISEGTNTLISLNVNDILIKIKEFGSRSGKTPRFWDGKATVRILDIINQLI